MSINHDIIISENNIGGMILREREYINRINSNYENPYIQIPRKLITETTAILRKYECEGYTAYATSFLILNGFLYKYAHYIDIDKGDYITISDIKKLLKYSPNNQRINRVSKRHDGILEYESLTESTADIPLFISYSKSSPDELDKRNILRMSDVGDDIIDIIKHDILKDRNYYSYIPTFMIDYSKKPGTMNDYRNTTRINYRELQRFLFNSDTNLRDFLTYVFVKSSLNKDGFANISYDRAQRGTGMSHKTFKNSTEKLKKLGIINIEQHKNVSRNRRSSKIYSICGKFSKLPVIVTPKH